MPEHDRLLMKITAMTVAVKYLKVIVAQVKLG
jgi:hypothetical protein